MDSEPQYRHIGDRRPEVIIVCEKTSLKDTVDELARLFGVSTIVLGGQPSLLCTEHFAHALRAVVTGPVTIIAYVDYDPAGWIIVRSFIEQLARIELTGGIGGEAKGMLANRLQPVERLVENLGRLLASSW